VDLEPECDKRNVAKIFMLLQSEVNKMLEIHYFPMVVYESMMNSHKFRLNEMAV
jgi:hypothetical protein